MWLKNYVLYGRWTFWTSYLLLKVRIQWIISISDRSYCWLLPAAIWHPLTVIIWQASNCQIAAWKLLSELFKRKLSSETALIRKKELSSVAIRQQVLKGLKLLYYPETKSSMCLWSIGFLKYPFVSSVAVYIWIRSAAEVNPMESNKPLNQSPHW